MELAHSIDRKPSKTANPQPKPKRKEYEAQRLHMDQQRHNVCVQVSWRNDGLISVRGCCKMSALPAEINHCWVVWNHSVWGASLWGCILRSPLPALCFHCINTQTGQDTTRVPRGSGCSHSAVTGLFFHQSETIKAGGCKHYVLRSSGLDGQVPLKLLAGPQQ